MYIDTHVKKQHLVAPSWRVLTVHIPQTGVVVPSGAELGSNFLLLVFSFKTADHFVLVDIADGTSMRYKLAYCT